MILFDCWLRIPVVVYSILLAFLPLLAPQSTAQVEVVYSTVPGDPSSRIPGSPGESFSHLGTPKIAGNGLASFVGHDPAGLDALIRGHEVVLREGYVFPGLPRWSVDLIFGAAVSAHGSNAAGVWIRDGTQTLKVVGALMEEIPHGWRILVRQGDSIPGWSGFDYGHSFDSITRLDDGRIAFKNTWFPGDGSDFWRPVLIFDGQTLARPGIDTPSGQQRVPAEPWQDFGYRGVSSDFMVSADGSTWACIGRVGSTYYTTFHEDGEVFAVNGTVIAEEDYPVHGTHFTQPFSHVNSATLSPDGRWWLCGGNTSGGAPGERSWLMSNGVVLAEAGDPLFPGSAETWSSLSSAASYGAHEYWLGYLPMIAGKQDQVVVHNRSSVVLRSGDALDLDGDGVSEGYEFERSLGDGQVDQHGRLTFVASIRHAVSGEQYRAQLRVRPSALQLELPAPIAGTTLNLGIRGAEPGAVGRVAYSVSGPGTTLLAPWLGGVLLDLAGPIQATSALVVDGQGNADWSKTIPAHLVGIELRAQGVVLDGAGLTPTNLRVAIVQ